MMRDGAARDAVWRLHNLRNDPAESQDLSKQRPALREQPFISNGDRRRRLGSDATDLPCGHQKSDLKASNG